MSVVGILVVLYVLFTYGIPFLANMSILLSGSKASEDAPKKQISFISSPTLDIPYSATNSATITIKGTAPKDHQVKLLVNDSVVDTVQVDDDSSFEFEDVELEEGENRIQAQAINKEKEESDLSSEVLVFYGHKQPSLSIESPSNGQNYPKEEPRSRVAGKTDPGTKVTVNGYWAIVDPSGNFSYVLPLSGGENTIKIIAEDQAGNKKEEERKVTLSQ